MAQNLDLRCVFGPSTLSPGKTRLESSIKKFKQHLIHVILFFQAWLCGLVLTVDGWDNSPRWGNGTVEAVDLNGWLHLDQLFPMEMARELGKDDAEVKASQSQMIASVPLFFKMTCKQNLDLGCVLMSDPSTLGGGAKTRLESRFCKQKTLTPI